jgi:hypothetical protein
VQLESRVLSDPSVRTIASSFVAVKIDPRETQHALEFKSTRYVPELVVLDASQNFIARIDDRDPEGVRSALANALTEITRQRSGR